MIGRSRRREDPRPSTPEERDARRRARARARAERELYPQRPVSASVTRFAVQMAVCAVALAAATATVSAASQLHSSPRVAPDAPAASPAAAGPPAAARETGSRGSGSELKRLPGGPDELLEIYRSAAAQFGIDWRVLASSGYSETLHGTYPAAGIRSAAGASSCCRGVMAVCIEGSCGSVWDHYATDGDGDGVRDPYEPADSIFTAAKIYRGIQNATGGDRRLMWASYNAGAGAVAQYGGVPPYPETEAYVERCEKYFEALGPR